MGRTKNFVPKITKEEFCRTFPYYCNCPDKEIIEWKESFRWNGVSKYVYGHQNKGRKWSEETNKKKGRPRESNPFYGKHHTKETIQIISENSSKTMKGRKLSKEHYDKIAQSNKRRGEIYKITMCGENNPFYGKHHTEESKQKIRGKNIGKFCGNKNPSWIDGRSFLPYCEKWTEELREKIRNLYGRKCFLCNLDERDNITKNNKTRKLDIHHIDSDKEQGCNGKKWHLIPLCMKCHSKTRTKNKKYYLKQHINELLKLYSIKDVWYWWDSYIFN